ncbi:MAG: hypothetical protein ACR2M1_14320 [Gemmatimonadaceae bacterium]
MLIQPPTVIIANARFSTGDPVRPWVTALALRDEALAAMGSAAEILKLADPATRLVDAGGRTIVLPQRLTAGDLVRVVFTSDSDFALVFS